MKPLEILYEDWLKWMHETNPAIIPPYTMKEFKENTAWTWFLKTMQRYADQEVAAEHKKHLERIIGGDQISILVAAANMMYNHRCVELLENKSLGTIERRNYEH